MILIASKQTLWRRLMDNKLEQLEKLEKLLGKKPRAVDLARYLGVTKSAVSQYCPKRRELMILGLWIKQWVDKNAHTE